MAPRFLSVLSLVSLTILSSCGGSGSPAGPTPTPAVISGNLVISVLSAYGTREDNGVKLHVTVRYVETAGGSTTFTKTDFLVKQNGASISSYENTESHIVGAKGSLELDYVSDQANNDPYPTTVDVTVTYTDSAGKEKTATASGAFIALSPA
jgi:hypothetical protein